jgi:hypothetical protein
LEKRDLAAFEEKITQSEDKYFADIAAARVLRTEASANKTVSGLYDNS